MSRFIITLGLALLSLSAGAVETTVNQTALGTTSTASPSQTASTTTSNGDHKRDNHGQKVKEVATDNTKNADKREENREVRQERRELRQTRREDRRDRRQERRENRVETSKVSSDSSNPVSNSEKHEDSGKHSR